MPEYSVQAQFPPFVEEEQEDSLAACLPDMNVFWLREAAGKLALATCLCALHCRGNAA